MTSPSYDRLYDEYWARPDRVGAVSNAAGAMADLIVSTCGVGRVLDVGCGEGFLVVALLARGIDARGLDVSRVVLDRAEARAPGRVSLGSVLALPYEDDAFDTVISTDCLEHLAPEDVPVALAELRRVAARAVFLQVATRPDRDGRWHLTVEGRGWWEARALEAGLRKHPRYHDVVPYESLNQDGWQILSVLEKVPDAALAAYDLDALPAERLLHSDHRRETGRRSEAHCVRYHEAARYVRPGDTVLDVACGLGYGTHQLFAQTQAAAAIGVDVSPFAIDYARVHYGIDGKVTFHAGDAAALTMLPDASIDLVTAFETIEHVPDPDAFLREVRRVLRPAGRLMISAPDEWLDESGQDPNPHHLHVFDRARLREACAAHFLLERAFVQVAGGALKCHHEPRSWRDVPVTGDVAGPSEWVLFLCMADPLGGRAVPYRETTWPIPDAPAFHVSAFARDYDNPWLVKGMVAIGMRATSPTLLDDLQRRVLANAAPESVDYGAALCGQAYLALAASRPDIEAERVLFEDIRRYVALPAAGPHVLRWQVSLLYVAGDLARLRGRFDEARVWYLACVEQDVTAYSPLLGNKVLDARQWLAVLALNRGDVDDARTHLLAAVTEAERLSTGDWLNVRGGLDAPLPFGYAEMAQLLDKASRAAYTLWVLDGAATRPGVVAREAQGYFERQLRDRDGQLLDLRTAVERLVHEVSARERSSQALAEQVQSQDAHAQGLAREVAAHDAHAQALAKAVGEREARMVRLGEEIAARDAQAQALAAEVVRLDAHAQALAREVAERDAHAQALARQVGERDAHAQALAAQVRDLDGRTRDLEQEAARLAVLHADELATTRAVAAVHAQEQAARLASSEAATRAREDALRWVLRPHRWVALLKYIRDLPPRP